MAITFPAGRQVLICDGCGKGFLAMPPSGVDLDPRWRWLGGNIESGLCGGAVLAYDIRSAMIMAQKPRGKIDE